MDTRTGEIHHIGPVETEAQFAQRFAELEKKLNAKPGDLVPLTRLPSKDCPKCLGTGHKKRGLFSRRFKPCECTQ